MKIRNRITAVLCTASLLSCPMHTAAESGGTFQWNRDEWQIANHAAYYQSSYQENMLPQHREALQANLNHVEYRLAEVFFDLDFFPGCCYGLSATSMLACYDIFNPDEHLDELGDCSGMQVTDDLFSLDRLKRGSKKETVYEQSLTFYYLALQTTDAIRQSAVKKCDWSLQEKMKYLLSYCADGKPVLLGWNWREPQTGDGLGHAVLAIGVESGDWTWNEKHYDKRILLYDSNNTYHSMDSKLKETTWEDDQIYVDSATGDFYYPYIFCDAESCLSLLVEEDPAVVNSKGLLETDPKYFPEQWTDVVTTNELESPYTLTRTNGQSDGISEYPMFYPDSDPYAVRNFSCKGEESAYVLNVEEPQLLHGCVYYRNSLLIGNSHSGKTVTFEPSGAVSVSGATDSYSLELVTNENYPTQWYDVIVSGTAANASLEAVDNGYVLKADDLHSVQITAKNLNSKLEQSYSADTDSILFYESSEGVLAAAVDLDGDGSYETALAEQFILGDVNQDGRINAKDASEVLIAAARLGTGQHNGLNETQQKAADVNQDGNINAVDATWILRYAAAVGTGTAGDTIEEYMKSA